MKASIGVYLGNDFVSVTVIEGRNIIKSSKCRLDSLTDGLDGNVSDDGVLWESLINKAFQDANIEASEVSVALGDKDFIFRCFEMPLMTKQEISNSLVFEVEKYLPFKIDELIWDFSFTKIAQDRKVNLSFLAIRNNIYKRYKSFFEHLNVKVKRVEPSALALVRTIKSLDKSLKKINNFALLDFSEGESYITFFYQDLPIFNRFLNITPGDVNDAIDQLKEEIRISIQYFRREFRKYDLESLIILCDSSLKDKFSSLKDDFEVESLIITPQEITGRDDFTVEGLKSYSAASHSLFNHKFKPDLRDSDDDPKSVVTAIFEDPFNYRLIFSAVALCVIGLFVLSLYFKFILKKEETKNTNLRKAVGAAMLDELKDAKLPDMQRYLKKRIKEKDQFLKVAEDSQKFYPVFSELEALLSDGLWLKSMVFDATVSYPSLRISGFVFLNNAFEERKSLDTFFLSLRQSDAFKSVFSKIEITSMKRTNLGSQEVLTFFIDLIGEDSGG